MSSLFSALKFDDLGSAIQSTVSLISLCLSIYAIIIAKKAIKTKVEVSSIDFKDQGPGPFGYALLMNIALSNTGLRDISISNFDIIFKPGIIRKLPQEVQQQFKNGMKLSFYVHGATDHNGKALRNAPFIMKPGQLLNNITLSGVISYKTTANEILFEDTDQVVYKLINSNMKLTILRVYLSNGKVVKVNGR